MRNENKNNDYLFDFISSSKKKVRVRDEYNFVKNKKAMAEKNKKKFLINVWFNYLVSVSNNVKLALQFF